ncbi:hypothetical protein Scep_007645 [Stephania cephalantha]|uniref:Uncharacterized protein n=1 Tax=Stephania cephalantha TaxID=152367 RepID=A0AAP0KA86_9MAGN
MEEGQPLATLLPFSLGQIGRERAGRGWPGQGRGKKGWMIMAALPVAGGHNGVDGVGGHGLGKWWCIEEGN